MNRTRSVWLLVAIATSLSGGGCNDEDVDVDVDGPDYEFSRIADLDAAKAENAFGLATLSNGDFVVSTPFLRELRVYHPSGELVKTFATDPALFFMSVLDSGTIVAGSAAVLDPRFNPDDPNDPGTVEAIANGGIWQIDVDQETTVQLAQMPSNVAPAHIVKVDDSWLVSNILGDEILAVDGSGAVTSWIKHPMLAGSPELPGPMGRPPFPIGIEGIWRDKDSLVGVVTDYGRIVRIAINADGSAGELSVVFEDPTELVGLAHFVLEDDGSMIAISGFQSKVWKIGPAPSFSITTLAENSSAAQVDTPAQIVRAGNGFLFTNNAFVMNDGKLPPRPGLTQITPR